MIVLEFDKDFDLEEDKDLFNEEEKEVFVYWVFF